MRFATEREEWLADWDDSRCAGEVHFEPAAGGARPAPLLAGPLDVFFSGAVEVEGRCYVCRAESTVVDIYDVSPGAETLVFWRVRLPDAVVPDGVSAVVSRGGGGGAAVLVLTRALVIHQVQLRHGPGGALDVHPAGSTELCAPERALSAFCALGPGLAAVGGPLGGGLLVVRLREGAGERGAPLGESELADASLVRRIFCATRPGGACSGPHALALAAVQPRGDGPAGAGGSWLLCFSADGKLRLWEVSERGHGRLLAAREVMQGQRAVAALGASSPYIRASPSGSSACLVLRGAVYVIRLPAAGAAALDGLAVTEVPAPFPGAAPSLATLSDEALWSFWSSHSREHLYRFNLEALDVGAFRSSALDAGLSGAGGDCERLHGTAAVRVAAEGCGAGEAGASNPVFTLCQQHEAWRSEEEAFISVPAAESQSLRGTGLLGAVLQWWVARVFLPGRYSRAVVATALQEAAASRGATAVAPAADMAARAVEEHLKRHPAVQRAQAREEAAGTRSAQVAAALGAAADEFLRACDAVWRRRHQACGLVMTGAWAEHAWYPPAAPGAPAPARPLLLCGGGVSCVRAAHSWPERWWSTLHLSRDLSRHDRLEIDDVLALSDLAEWKLCVTAWFLSQCIGAARVSLSVGSLSDGGSSSSCLRPLAGDVPAHLASHVARCMEAVRSDRVAAGVDGIAAAVRALCCPEQRGVQSMLDTTLEPPAGVWSAPSAAPAPPCLSDVLRGGAAASECGHLHAALRDLMLLCAYADPGGRASGAESSWTGLSELLDAQLPTYEALLDSVKLEVPAWPVRGSLPEAALPARVCDLWASRFRAPAGGRCVAVPAPPASLQSLQYAMCLQQHGCWEALRHWRRQQQSDELGAYFDACERLAAGQPREAREAFDRSEGAAALVAGCLRSPLGVAAADAAPPRAAFWEHVASLYAAAGHPAEECDLLWQAAALAEEALECPPAARERLWREVFDKALAVGAWSQAAKSLEHIGSFEGRLRLLAKKLRSCGKIELMSGLPPAHRAVFMSELHERASAQPPVAGSDSAACYALLYSLHLKSGEHQQAAAVAHTMFAALAGLLWTPDAGAGGQAPESFLRVRTGGSASDPADVPKPSDALLPPSGAADGPAAFARMLGFSWPVLEQQRSALLMLISALALSPQKALLLPPASSAPMEAPVPMDCREGATTLARPPAGLRAWLAKAGRGAAGRCISLRDAQGLLAVVEARAVLSGREDSWTARGPAETARTVAALGLLSLALQVVDACGLDAWECALRPFARLCASSAGSSDDQVAATVGVAAGPLLSHMFVRSDGREPVGVRGDLREGWWRMLEDSLAARCSRRAGSLDAGGARLYSLVVDEVLSSQPAGATAKLRDFLVDALSEGPSWAILLRLYMRHGRLDDAVDLMERQLHRCRGQPLQPGGALGAPALRDFPTALAVQLRHAVAASSASPESCRINAILDEFHSLLVQQDADPHAALEG